jgi:hypothetical protein
MSNKIFQWLKSLNVKKVSSIVIAVVLLGSTGVVLTALNAANFRSSYEIDGGGGGDYEIENVRIPEITPPQPVTITAEFPDQSGITQGAYTTTIQVQDTLWYAWNRGMGYAPSKDNATNGWATGLSNPNITIGYDVRVLDAQSGSEITDGRVALNQNIVLKFEKYVSDNIFWFGTGYSMDSPYGAWSVNAAPPPRVANRVTCESKDYVVRYTYQSGQPLIFDIFVPFQVHPPERSIVPASLTGLTCEALEQKSDGTLQMPCRVTTEGVLTPTFKFEQTYGKFYYRYNDNRDLGEFGNPGCHGNNIAMAKIGTPAGGAVANSESTMHPAYVVRIPAKEIPIELIAGTGTQPSTPILNCPSTVTVGSRIEVSLSSTDPANNQVRYGIDWDTANPTREVTSGWTPYVSSGTSQTLTKTGGYTSAGTYEIFAQSQNSVGQYSGWRMCRVTVTSNTPACSDGLDNNNNGLIDYPNDPGCSSAGDSSEAVAQCSDGIDNDGNGLIDYPGDTGCSSALDDIEGDSTAQSVSLAADPTRVKRDTRTTLTWTVSQGGALDCTLSGTNNDSWQISTQTGSVQSSPILDETTYTLRCAQQNRSPLSTSVVVKILPTFQEF